MRLLQFVSLLNGRSCFVKISCFDVRHNIRNIIEHEGILRELFSGDVGILGRSFLASPGIKFVSHQRLSHQIVMEHLTCLIREYLLLAESLVFPDTNSQHRPPFRVN